MRWNPSYRCDPYTEERHRAAVGGTTLVTFGVWWNMCPRGDLLLLLCVIVLQQLLGVNSSTEGSEFLIAFLENAVLPLKNPEQQCIFITTKNITPIQAVVDSLDSPVNYHASFNVNYQTGAMACIANDIQLSGDGTSSKLLSVKAPGNISVIVLDNEVKSMDTYIAIPVALFGNDYYVMSMPTYPGKDFLSEFCIISSRNSTTVTLEFPSDGYYELEYQGITVISPGTFTLTLQEHEVFQLQNPTDLTGVYISSDKPIGVLSGHQKSGTGASWNLDHFVQQMTPIVTWGTDFVTVPTPQIGTALDVYRVLASTPNTTIYVNGTTWELKEEGDYVEIELTSELPQSLTSDNAVLVVKYIPNIHTLTDTCTMIIVPCNQWMTVYTFKLESVISEGYIIVVVPTRDRDTLKLNGSPLAVSGWAEVVLEDVSVGYLSLTAGDYLLTSDQDIPFMAYLHQFHRNQAFCSPVGMNLEPINANWTHTQPKNITTTCTTTATPTAVSTSIVTTEAPTTENPTTTVIGTTTENAETTAESTIETTITITTNTAITTEVATTEQPLTVDTTETVSGAEWKNDTNCSCEEESLKSPLLNITEEELQLFLRILKTSLKIKRNETSKYLRSKMSIPDNRPVPTSLGVFGSALISITVCLICLQDAGNLLNHLFRGPFYNIQSKPKGTKGVKKPG